MVRPYQTSCSWLRRDPAGRFCIARLSQENRHLRGRITAHWVHPPSEIMWFIISIADFWDLSIDPVKKQKLWTVIQGTPDFTVHSFCSMMNSLSSIPPVESWPEAATSPAHSESPNQLQRPAAGCLPDFLPVSLEPAKDGLHPPGPAQAIQTVPTGLPNPSPPGPARPVVDTATSAERAAWAPGPWPRPLVRRRRPNPGGGSPGRGEARISLHWYS